MPSAAGSRGKSKEYAAKRRSSNELRRFLLH